MVDYNQGLTKQSFCILYGDRIPLSFPVPILSTLPVPTLTRGLLFLLFSWYWCDKTWLFISSRLHFLFLSWLPCAIEIVVLRIRIIFVGLFPLHLMILSCFGILFCTTLIIFVILWFLLLTPFGICRFLTSLLSLSMRTCRIVSFWLVVSRVVRGSLLGVYSFSNSGSDNLGCCRVGSSRCCSLLLLLVLLWDWLCRGFGNCLLLGACCRFEGHCLYLVFWKSTKKEN